MLLRALPVRTTATDGLLLVDKGSGVTSHDVVALARRSLRTRRVGHTGTLDPFPTGLPVLLVGRAPSRRGMSPSRAAAALTCARSRATSGGPPGAPRT